ncbi:uncharacterized protein LOC129583143 isoform X2 [Paramacrobiotus metropolitanus]|nr:uncharacterized protein LOC129583143 isoform X2 [Paramacrobiotus metropolitanus]
MDLSPALSATVIPESPAAKLEKVKARLAAERGINKYPSAADTAALPADISPRPVKSRKHRQRKELIPPDDDHLGSDSAGSEEDGERDDALTTNGQREASPSLLGRVMGQTVGGVSAVVGDVAAAISGAVFSSAVAMLETFGGPVESSDDETEKILSKPSIRRPDEPHPADEAERRADPEHERVAVE